MNAHAQAPQQRRHQHRDRTFAVLHALLQLGPGPHRFHDIVQLTDLSVSEVHRRLRQLVSAEFCYRPRHGYYQLHAATADIAGPPGLVCLPSTPLLDTTDLLNDLHRRTQQVVLLHTYMPLSRERVCIAAAGTDRPDFRRELALTPRAIDLLRQAPLDQDAAGLAILANLTDQDDPLRADLRGIRSAQLARSAAPLPGWTLLSVPVRRLPGAPAWPGAEPGVVAAVSLLAPEPAQGTHLIAYGKLLQSTVRKATEATVVITQAAQLTPQTA